METKINIAEILRNKLHGIKLYSPIFGDCTFCYVREDTNDICIKKRNGVIEYFNSEGLYFALGEVMLFPSKSMRDWEKFTWKTGEVLVSNDGKREVLFKTWVNDSYTKFVGFHCLIINDNKEVEYDNGTTVFNTNDFKGIEAENAIQTYINTIEERLGGKLNYETLEIENAQPEFKDGDIVVTAGAPYLYYSKCIIILKGDLYTKDNKAHSYAFYNINNKFIDFDIIDTRIRDREIRLATDSEKQQLFSALEKEGKSWDAEKKQIVDLKPKYEFKPMDLCLMKYIGQYNNRGWELCQYAYTEHRVSSSGEQRDFYHSVGGEIYAECIPYNEDTKHLLGTKKEWKGGEG